VFGRISSVFYERAGGDKSRFRWKVAGRSVEGATRSTLRVPTPARGKRVSVVVTGSLAGYTTKSVSQSTGVIR
jgi:hypothetical protein